MGKIQFLFIFFRLKFGFQNIFSNFAAYFNKKGLPLWMI